MHQGILQRFVEWVIQHGGLYMLLLIVFAETGLFVGFFLPGDSLLFTAGIYINELASHFYNANYILLISIVIFATFSGSMVGYWIGYRTGRRMLQWKDSLIFKKKYLIQANDFYKHYGKATVFFSKFLPVIRTFAPLVAGMVRMPAKNFITYNLLGSICWVTIIMLSGYLLQSWFLKHYGFDLKDHIELIAVIVILTTTLPILYKLIFSDKKKPQHSKA